MRLVRFYIMVVSVLWALPSGVARAQDTVSLRMGRHEGYSRLVFAWSSPPSYTLDQSHKGRVRVVFKKPAHLMRPETKAMENILGLSVESETPLRIAITTPDKSRVRDMKTGNRLVLDIYDPPSGPVPPPVEKPAKEKNTSNADPQKTSEKTSPSGKEKKSENPTVTAPLKVLPLSAVPSTPSEQVLSSPQAVPVARAASDKKGRTVPSTVFFSAMQAFGLAVFLKDDHVYILNDKSDILIEPQIKGPQAAKIGPLKEIKTPSGKLYQLSLPEKNHLKTQGKGLTWRISFSDDFLSAEGLKPQRAEINDTQIRSGKLVWPFKTARTLIKVTDPETGTMMYVVTVGSADDLGGLPRHYVDFDVLESPVGLAIMPKVDDLDVRLVTGMVEISRPEGLTLVSETAAQKSSNTVKKAGSQTALNLQRIFDFKGWQLGGLPAQGTNRTILLEEMNEQDEAGQVENLLTLAKMYLSNAMGSEALGFLEFAAELMPELQESQEYKALYGVAVALNLRSEEAFRILSDEQLKPFQEINLWRAYALADLGDWQQAIEILPDSTLVMEEYPDLILNRLGPVMAEIALRGGDVKLGNDILALLDKNEPSLLPPQKAAIAYLKGEAARQAKNVPETKKLWNALMTGPDELYRAKAGLAFMRLGMDKKELPPTKAIDTLERLRYAWRGDELEAQVNYWLGRMYFESGEYIRGLNLMQDSAFIAPESNLAKRVAGDMTEIFAGLFLGKDFEKISPQDAVTLYENFPAVIPQDARKKQIMERLAEYLVKVDLLDRSAAIYARELQDHPAPAETFRIATRLAAIRLLDEDPAQALPAINLAAQNIETFPEVLKKPENTRVVSLLRARALSLQGRPDQAMALLNEMPLEKDVNRLRADIAWAAGYWDDAAEALGDVITDENISLTRPLAEGNTALVLQRVIALSLAGDRIALANMREKYSDAMMQTDKAKVFEVITRPRKSAALADRDTLLRVVKEVDLFSDFLKSYKAGATPAPSPSVPPSSAPKGQ